MKKIVQTISASFLVLVMLMSFSSCGNKDEQEYYSKVEKLAEEIAEVSNEISSMNSVSLSTQEGYNDFVEKVEQVNNYVDEIAELETPEKYADAQELFAQSRDKWKECLEIYKSIDMTAEDAGTKATEAAEIYEEAANLLTEAATKVEEIYES